MGWAQIVLSSVLSLQWTAPKNYAWDEIIPSQTLTWYPCLQGRFCAKLDVPLDYHNPDLGRASIPLLKHPAETSSPDGAYQGMILINPGGPGGSGVEEARERGAQISTMTGSNWDIVGFDPRGMHLSRPLLDCPVNQTGHHSTSRFVARDTPRLTDEFYDYHIDFANRLGQHCQDIAGNDTQAGPHMSTAVVARDMARIVDAYAATQEGKSAAKNSQLLNYYGISYGSFLGQTFASMFPEKVGQFVVDGIVGPGDYLSGSPASAIHHLDGIIGSYFIYCFEAGNVTCPFSAGSSTPKDVYERFHRSFAQLDAKQAQKEGWDNATDIETALRLLKLAILGASYDPIGTFANFSGPFISLETSVMAQDLGPFIEDVLMLLGDRLAAVLDDAQFVAGVLCSDQGTRHQGKTLDDMRPWIEELERESIIGETWIRPILFCLGWTIQSKDIFTGPFGGETATPILFVANTYDTVTPIEDAIEYAPKFKGAEILTIDATGHTSLFALNKCAFAKIKAYFQTTQLPGNESRCPLESGPFGIQLKGSLQENLKRSGLADLHI